MVVQESCFIMVNEFTFTIKLLADAFIYKTNYKTNRLVILKFPEQVDKVSNQAENGLDKPIHSPNCVSYLESGKLCC